MQAMVRRPGEVSAARSDRQRHLSGTMALSVLAHIGIGYLVLTQLIGMKFSETEPEPIRVEIQPLVRPAAPPPPAVQPDEIRQPERPRATPREVAVPKVHTDVPPLPLAPQPPTDQEGGTVTTLPETVPAMAPAPTRKVQPTYPPRAEEREIAGRATVEITVGAGGAVSAIRLVQESPQGYGFGDAAIDAVARWEFASAQPGTYRVTVKFALD